MTLEQRAESPVSVRLASEPAVLRAINRLYEQHAREHQSYQSHPSLKEALAGAGSEQDADDLLESETRGPVVQLVNQLLMDAIQGGASDIHLQPFGDHVSVRLRLDGVLTESQSLRKNLQ